MALNLKTFGTRSLTALFFVLVLLSALLFSYSGFTVFFYVVLLLAVQEFCKMAEHLGASCNKALFMLLASLVYLSSVNWNHLSLAPLSRLFVFGPDFACLFSALLLLFFSLFQTKADALKSAALQILGMCYVAWPLSVLHRLAFPAEAALEFEPRFLLGIILLIWSNDTFAYLGGSLFGKRKLIERISPGKTIEGTLLGLAITFALSFLLKPLLGIDPPMAWAWFGFSVPLAATAGDLIESLIKRQAGIKDSGHILPGHGGVLDRFDSLIFVAPVVLMLLKCL